MIDEAKDDQRKGIKASLSSVSKNKNQAKDILQTFIRSLYTLPLSVMVLGCPSGSRQGILAVSTPPVFQFSSHSTDHIHRKNGGFGNVAASVKVAII